MESIQVRILAILKDKNITPYRFCKDLGLSQGYLDKRGSIGTDKFVKISYYFKDVHPRWLLTGIGHKYRGDYYTSPEIQGLQGLPMLPLDGLSSNIDAVLEAGIEQGERYYIPELRERLSEFMLKNTMGGMEPILQKGDILSCRTIHPVDLFVDPQAIYVCETQQGMFIRYLKALPSGHYALCSPNGEELVLKKEQFTILAIVTGLVRCL